MDTREAVAALSALAQENRLRIFRMLVKCGADGIAAGDIARRLGVPQNTLSFHVAALSRAGLVTARKAGRSVFYSVDLKGTRALLSFLLEDCCQGEPELCAALLSNSPPRRREPTDEWEETMTSRNDRQLLNVLFLCTGNSARSIMAEAILGRLGLGKFKAFSAGSHPRGEVNPHAMAMLRKANFDVSKLRSKSWDEFAEPGAPKLDFVFTVCDDAAQEVCPVWPGQPMSAHWGLPDPARAEGSDAEQALAFADCFRMLYQRISIFVSLPFDRLSKLSLQQRLDEIGRSRADAMEEPA